jgi:hypothetical protein
MKEGPRKQWRESKEVNQLASRKPPPRIQIKLKEEHRSSVAKPKKELNNNLNSATARKKRTMEKDVVPPAKKRPRIHIVVPARRNDGRLTTTATTAGAGSKVQDLEVREIGYMSTLDSSVEKLQEDTDIAGDWPSYNFDSVEDHTDDRITKQLDEEEFDLFSSYLHEGDDDDPLMHKQILAVEGTDICWNLQNETSSNCIMLSDSNDWGVLSIRQLGMKALGQHSFKKNFLEYHMYALVVGTRKSTMHASCIRVSEDSSTALPFAWDPPAECCPFLIAGYFPKSIVASDGVRYHETKNKATQYCLMQAVLAGDAKFVADELESRFLRGEELQRVLFDPNPNKGGNTKVKEPFAVVTRETNGVCSFSFLDNAGVYIGPTINSLETSRN